MYSIRYSKHGILT